MKNALPIAALSALMLSAAPAEANENTKEVRAALVKQFNPNFKGAGWQEWVDDEGDLHVSAIECGELKGNKSLKETNIKNRARRKLAKALNNPAVKQWVINGGMASYSKMKIGGIEASDTRRGMLDNGTELFCVQAKPVPKRKGKGKGKRRK